MKLSVTAVQFNISLSIKKNLETILGFIEQTKPGDVVVFPEGSVSGYSTNMSFLDRVDLQDVNDGLDLLESEAKKREIILWVGACVKENGHWINAAFGFSPNNEHYIYRKINLATHERGIFSAGNELPVFQTKTEFGTIPIGVQICREIRYPEQWGWLSRCGAQLILHLNNAVGDSSILPVWRSYLISRAAENQRYVVSANNAAPGQKSPTIIIGPDGKVIGEAETDNPAMLHAVLDMSCVADWNLDQCRSDVIQVKPPKG